MGILNFFSRGSKQQKSYLAALLEVAMADGELDRFEWEYLGKIAKRMGISEKVLLNLRDKQSNIDYIPPRSRKEMFQQLYELICMMMIDGEIHRKEQRLIGTFAKKMGYAEDKVDELVYSIGQNVSMGNSETETLKRVSFILNQ